GDRVAVRIDILPPGEILNWSVEVSSPGGERQPRQAQSTLRGLLVSREDLARSRPDFVPQLSERGRARVTGLQLCDGRRSLGEIEARVFERHGTLFQSQAEASAFVAEIVASYTNRS